MLAGWELPEPGVLFVVSGPSGVGKSTLVRQAMNRIPGLSFSVSATTRPPRHGELDGVHYHFVTPDRFATLAEADAFLEHATVYDRRYGTLRAETEGALSSGRSIVLDIDVQGARQVRARMPEAVHVFVLPPSVAVLEARLTGRGSEGAELIARRMALATEQLRGCPEYDYVVVNDDLETADATFQGILLAEMSRIGRRGRTIARVLGEVPARGGVTGS
ncbi:MAG: guanylate kinase [Myxococcota bacterium]